MGADQAAGEFYEESMERLLDRDKDLKHDKGGNLEDTLSHPRGLSDMHTTDDEYLQQFKLV